MTVIGQQYQDKITTQEKGKLVGRDGRLAAHPDNQWEHTVGILRRPHGRGGAIHSTQQPRGAQDYMGAIQHAGRTWESTENREVVRAGTRMRHYVRK